MKAAVYFCALEALNNVAKYAEATRATVTLSKQDGRLTFSVHDHGRGLDPKKVERAVNLSAEKYCSATAMLAKTAQISHEIEIIDPSQSGATA